MLDIQIAIAPIFVLIVLGHLLRRGGIPSFEFWNLNDRLVYWVLFPSLLFYKMSTMTLSISILRDFGQVVVGGFLAVLCFTLVCGFVLHRDRPMWTSVLQGSVRHNTFIALAVAEELFGTVGLQLATLITAILIPLTNISIVSLMILILTGFSGKNVLRTVARELVRNPLLIAVAAGLLANNLGAHQIPVVTEVVRILGGAALPIVLLCVGANIRIRAMSVSLWPTLLSMLGKMLIFPLAILLLSGAIGLDAQATMIALIFGAVPTAAGAYSLARQMGGDAPVMATIVTLQTAISFVTLPITLIVAARYLGLNL